MSRIGILAFREFEDAEVAGALRHFRAAGHEVVVIGGRAGVTIPGRQRRTGVETEADFGGVAAESLDALIVPGDESVERLRSNEEAIALVRRFWHAGRPIAAIEEGVELLRVAGVLKGVSVTSPPALRHHLQNAGARWLDCPLVIDEHLITARSRTQLTPLCRTLEQQL